MGEVCSTLGVELYTAFLVGKSEGKSPLGRRRCKLKNNIKMDLPELDGTWTVLIWLRSEIRGKLLSMR